MRSLTVKLTLAFVFIGVLGALLVALITSRRTQVEFSRFVDTSQEEQLVTALSDFYRQAGSWDTLGPTFERSRLVSLQRRPITLVDNNNALIFSRPRRSITFEQVIDSAESVVPIEVDGETVGSIYYGDRGGGGGGNRGGRFAAEQFFLRRVAEASAASALIATLLALGIGIVFTRTLMRPIQQLTAATKRVAAGEFGQQVAVETNDEIGELSRSFNQMSRDLERASQARRQMTADIAHDLRTPLTILRGYTEGLRSGALEGNPRLYDTMYEEVVHLQHLVDDLRTLSLADAGELSLNRRAVDPKALLERTALAYVMSAEQQGVALRIEAEDNLPPTHVDAERITQVLNNLVSNALRFTQQGEIVLRASAEADGTRFEVRDTGSGIASNALPHIFERFYRADASRHRPEQGSSGLGLAIAKAIVTAHGGMIGATSPISADANAPGAAFEIYLPTSSS